MLSTQIDFWAYKEAQRHNLESEAISWFGEREKQRHNTVSEAQGWQDLSIKEFSAKETQRHNVQTESLGWANLSETQRHNVVTESVSIGNLSENVRHNKASEALGWGNINLGYSQLAETTRHNYENEAIGMWTAEISEYNAETHRSEVESQNLRRDYQNLFDQQEVDIKNQNARTQLYNTQLDAAELYWKYGLQAADQASDNLSVFHTLFGGKK